MTTDLEIKPGERTVFSATGTGRCPGQDAYFGPAGLRQGYRDLLRVLPVQTGRGALIGRIGEAGVANAFAIGTSTEVVATAAGRLALGTNRAASDVCTATFSVHVEVFGPLDATKTIAARRVDRIDGVDDTLVAGLPRRIHDRQGNPGDMVNFLILGTEAGMQRVFKAAGWVKVDADVRGALITASSTAFRKRRP